MKFLKLSELIENSQFYQLLNKIRIFPRLHSTKRLSNNFYPQGSELSIGEIKNLFLGHFYNLSVQYPTLSKIKDVEIIGSRAWGKPNPNSDLDILVYYEGKTSPQDMKNLFSMSNTRLDLGNFEADITFTKAPIEEWIKRSFRDIR